MIINVRKAVFSYILEPTEQLSPRPSAQYTMILEDKSGNIYRYLLLMCPVFSEDYLINSKRDYANQPYISSTGKLMVDGIILLVPDNSTKLEYVNALGDKESKYINVLTAVDLSRILSGEIVVYENSKETHIDETSIIPDPKEKKLLMKDSQGVSKKSRSALKLPKKETGIVYVDRPLNYVESRRFLEKLPRGAVVIVKNSVFYQRLKGWNERLWKLPIKIKKSE